MRAQSIPKLLSSFSPLPRGWGVWLKVLASSCGLVFVLTSPHPEAVWESTKSHLIRTKEAPIAQEIPRDSGTRVTDQILKQKMPLALSSLRNHKGLRHSGQELRTRTDI